MSAAEKAHGQVDLQFTPSIFEMEAIFPAPNACAGRAKISKTAMTSTEEEMVKEGIFAGMAICV
jgi:hypothetical protein